MSIMTGAPAQAQTAPAPPPPDNLGTGDEGRKRILLIAGGGLALIVVAALAYFFLLSGSSDGGGSAALAAPKVTHTAPSPKASTPAIAPLKSFAGKTARNPFKSLVSPILTSGGTGTSGTTGTGTTTPATGSGTGSTGTTGTTGTTTPTRSSVPLTVVLKSIKANSTGATISVTAQGGKAKSFSPALGATFDTYFQLTGFAGQTGQTPDCVLLQYGDTSSMLCTNETLTVQ